MKWFTVVAVAALAAAPGTLLAQDLRFVPIGNIAQIPGSGPTTWGISGMSIVNVARSANGLSPLSRTLMWDARTVEILSRTENPPLRMSDTRVAKRSGRYYVTVRNYVLMEVTPQDARAAGTSVPSLAREWASRVRRVLPQVAPMPSRFGV